MTYYRIRELREDKDLTQTYVAHYLNVTQKTYWMGNRLYSRNK